MSIIERVHWPEAGAHPAHSSGGVCATGWANSESGSASAGGGDVSATTDGQYGIPDFYTPPSPLPAGTHGDLIRSEEIHAPEGARVAHLYLPELGDGTPVAVSGFVVSPDTPAPSGGRKVIAWAHGTGARDARHR